MKIPLLWLLFGMIWIGCKSDSPTPLASVGDPEIDALNIEISKDLNNPDLYFKRAQKYYEKAAYESTLLDLKRALAIDSLNPQYYHLMADAYLDNFNSDEAISTLYKVLKIYPDRPQTMLKLAELKYIIEDYDGSILVLNELIKSDDQSAEAYYMLGVNFKVIGETDRAISAYQTAAEMDSKLTDAWIGLGEIYESKKDPKALKFFDNAVLSNPQSMSAKHAKAYYLQSIDKISEAKSIYREIVVTDQNYQDAYLNLGLLYMDEDSIDKAYDLFNNLASIAPTNPRGFYYRAMVNEKRGKKAEAIKDLQSARNLNADDPKIAEALKRLESK
jgi:tetratricopeptide (TPR) repeat protein